MALDVSRAVGDGGSGVLTSGGLAVVAAIGALAATLILTINSIFGDASPAAGSDAAAIGPSVPIPVELAVLLFVGTTVALTVVTAGAIRTFANDVEGTIPREYLTRNAGEVVRSYLVGSIVQFVIVAFGLSLLFVHPMLFLAALGPLAVFVVGVCLWFVVVAVEDEHYAAAYTTSWGITEPYRGTVLEFVFVVGLVTVGASVLVGVVVPALPPWLSLVGFAVVVGLSSTFFLATTSNAYRQLA